MPFISGDGAPPPLFMVVEYLESSMSNDLLYKFPDNSSFDFNYTQSSIWSPLLPRPPPPSSATRGGGAKQLSFGGNGGVGLIQNTKIIAANIKRKFTDAVLNNVSRCTKMKRRRKKSFGFSPVAPPPRRSAASTTSPKGWAKVIKGAAKHFKKRKIINKISNFDFDFSNFSTQS